MRNLLALFALIIIGFSGVGYILGWYKVQTSTTLDGSTSVIISFNNKKISVDVDKGRDYLQEKIKAAEESEKKLTKGAVETENKLVKPLEVGTRAQR